MTENVQERVMFLLTSRYGLPCDQALVLAREAISRAGEGDPAADGHAVRIIREMHRLLLAVRRRAPGHRGDGG